MCCRSSPELLSPETVTKLQEWFVQAVDTAMQKRGISDAVYEAWTDAGGGVNESGGQLAGQLGAAARLYRDDGVRILVELINTAAVMQALGEFPAPDAGQTDRVRPDEV